MTTTHQHRDTVEGLYARLYDATYHAHYVIKQIHDDLPETADRPARVQLLEALEAVHDTAYSKHRINYTGVVGEEAFADALNWHMRHFIGRGWERTGANDVDWSITLKFRGDETGFVTLVVDAKCTRGEVTDYIVEEFSLSFHEGESLYRAIGDAHTEAFAFLRGIKRAYNI